MIGCVIGCLGCFSFLRVLFNKIKIVLGKFIVVEMDEEENVEMNEEDYV